MQAQCARFFTYSDCSWCIPAFACFRPLFSLLLIALVIAVLNGHKCQRFKELLFAKGLLAWAWYCCWSSSWPPDELQTLRKRYPGQVWQAWTKRNCDAFVFVSCAACWYVYIYIYCSAFVGGGCNCWYIYIYYVYNVVCSFVHLISSLLYALELEVPADLEGPARQIRPDSWPIR